MGADVQSYEQRAQNAADEMAAKLRAPITTMEDPKVEELFTNVYAEPHEPTERAAKNYLDYLAEFEGGE